MAPAGVGLGGDDEEVGDGGVCAKNLGPSEFVAAGNRIGPRRDARDVGAGAGLRHRDRGAEIARDQARQQPRLLHFVAAIKNCAQGRPLHDQQIGGVVADPVQLLDGEAGGEDAVGAAVFLREGQREEPLVAQEIKHVLGIGRVAVDRRRARRHLVAGERPDGVAEQHLLRRQFELGFHRSRLPSCHAARSLARAFRRPQASPWKPRWIWAIGSPGSDNRG